MVKKGHGALVGLTLVIGASVRKKDAKRGRAYAYRPLTFGSIFDQKSLTNRFKNTSKKTSSKNMEFDTKGVLK